MKQRGDPASSREKETSFLFTSSFFSDQKVKVPFNIAKCKCHLLNSLSLSLSLSFASSFVRLMQLTLDRCENGPMDFWTWKM